MLRSQPVKVLHALGDPHYNWYLVTPHETFEREKRPPGAKHNPRPTVRVPAEQENIRCIEAHNAFQIPWTHNNIPKRTGRAPSHGMDRASAANANTTERSANLLETSFSITDEASLCSLSSTNSSRGKRHTLRRAFETYFATKRKILSSGSTAWRTSGRWVAARAFRYGDASDALGQGRTRLRDTRRALGPEARFPPIALGRPSCR
jgi:hypothetical protein